MVQCDAIFAGQMGNIPVSWDTSFKCFIVIPAIEEGNH